MIGTSDTVRGKKRDDFVGSKAGSISEAFEDRGHGVLRLRDQPIRWDLLSVGPASQELETRSARALREAHCTSELNQVTGGDIVVVQEWREEVNRIDDTEVSMEVGLGIREQQRRSVSSTTTIDQSELHRREVCSDRIYPNLPSLNIFGEKAIASWKVRRTDS
jgi:hypothetical protein